MPVYYLCRRPEGMITDQRAHAIENLRIRSEKPMNVIQSNFSTAIVDINAKSKPATIVT